MAWLCRDCLVESPEARDLPARCPSCAGPRLIGHPELGTLSIAHIDCDAFYATIEKRDRPELRDKPVIVGGRTRGVVAAACYVARLYGVRSAMPMFKALRACPDAVVIPPDMAKYKTVGRAAREIMLSFTPLVEPLSIDEAFLDLTGTQALHGGSPARALAMVVQRFEATLGISASIGLSCNKFLAKIASDLDKPRGFAVIGRAEAEEFLADKPVGIIYGVGRALQRTLARDAVRNVGDLRRFSEQDLLGRYGAIGIRLYHFCRGNDSRKVDPNTPTKSISAETTFNQDLTEADALLASLWPLCETVSRRLKKAELAGVTVTLKLKTADFKLLTRSARLTDATQLAEELYRAGGRLLQKEADGRAFRLIGIGAGDLCAGALADPPNLLDPGREQRRRVEAVLDELQDRLGPDSIKKGRGL